MKVQKRFDFAPPWRWGIFRRKPCQSLVTSAGPNSYQAMLGIYRALKQAGYRETYWQFVYEGQIGGLIKNPNNNLIEFHVRFFEDGMIYAEMELGRSALLHFLTPRCYLNDHLVKTMGSRLSEQEQSLLRSSTEKYKATHPRPWKEWKKDERFMTPSLKRQVRLLTLLSDWRTLALIMLGSVVSSLADRQTFFPLLIALMIFVYLLAPKRAQ